jgi:hypothetical protein
MKLLLENWRQYLNEEATLEIPSWAIDIKQRYDSVPKTQDTFRQYAAEIRDAYNQAADQAFLNDFVYIHFVRQPQWLKSFIEGGVDSGSDLSTMGYPKGSDLQRMRTWADIGVLIEGEVVLAGIQDLQTDLDKPSVRRQPGYKKYTGKPEALIANAEDFEKSGAEYLHEAVVTNWKIVGIVLPKNTIPEQFEEIVQQTSLPIYDSRFQPISMETPKL